MKPEPSCGGHVEEAIVVEEIMEQVIIEKTAAMENFEILMLDADSSNIVVEEEQDRTPTGPGNDSVIDIEAERGLGLITEVIDQDDQEDEADVLLFADILPVSMFRQKKSKRKRKFQMGWKDPRVERFYTAGSRQAGSVKRKKAKR